MPKVVDAKWGVINMRAQMMKKVKDKVLSEFIFGVVDLNPGLEGLQRF